MYYNNIFLEVFLVKFIKTNSPRSEYDVFEDEHNVEETSKPRWIPSYHDATRKKSSKNQTKKHP